jgi:hypothetical protein
MPPAMFNTSRVQLVKRELLKMNIGGRETNPHVIGDRNHISFNTGSRKEEDGEETLLRKTGTEIGRILEGGTNVVLAPAKWLSHMQENWYAFN